VAPRGCFITALVLVYHSGIGAIFRPILRVVSSDEGFFVLISCWVMLVAKDEGNEFQQKAGKKMLLSFASEGNMYIKK
jgi:hypothetical protein